MIDAKRILGVALALMGASFIFDISFIQNIIMDYPIFSIGILAASSYFLIKSGARR